MKALIAAGGHATRLRPITATTNKHLIPLGGVPMLFLALEKIAETGITEVGISVNPGDTAIAAAVGDGSRWGVRITIIEQAGGPRGVAHVVANARAFLGDEPFLFYLGDNIVLGSLARFVERFTADRLDCMLALARVPDPERFGVPVFEDGRIVRVEEKPAAPAGNLVQTGIYLYSNAFFDAFARVVPSPRGEYEISDVNTRLIEDGRKVGWEEITGYWKDSGKPRDLLEGNASVMDEALSRDATVAGAVDPGATVEGKARIGRGTRVGAGCRIVGPVTIGDDCVLEDATIGPYASLGDGVVVRGATVSRSILFDRVTIDGNLRVAQSIIGYDARVSSAAGAGGESSFLLGDNSRVEM